MANDKNIQYGIATGVAGVASGWLLGIISKFASMIPGVSVNLQSIAITTTGLNEVINPGLNTFAKKLLGLVPNLPIGGMDIVYLAIGGFLFGYVGSMLVEGLGVNIAKTKAGKLATVFVVAGLATTAILTMGIQIPAVTALIITMVDAFLLAYVLTAVDEAAGLNLIP